jgi:spermidine synthase
VLYLDGLHQANDSPEMVHVHRQIGVLAAALHPMPQRALVVGLGGGVTPGGVATRPGVAVDVVELSAPVLAAATWFDHVNFGVLQRPSVTLHVNDGRNHLFLGRQRYDVITADIIQPFHAGAGNVYSAEYFRLGREALADGGLMVQWVGQRAATQYRLIARTFLSVFPDATAWAGGTLLVAGRDPLRVHRADFERMLHDPAWRATMASVGIMDFDDLARLYTAGPEALRTFVGDGPVLTDDRPLVEFFRSLPRAEADIDLSRLQGDPREVLIGLQDRD